MLLFQQPPAARVLRDTPSPLGLGLNPSSAPLENT